jgi:hypothetical protein
MGVNRGDYGRIWMRGRRSNASRQRTRPGQLRGSHGGAPAASAARSLFPVAHRSKILSFIFSSRLVRLPESDLTAAEKIQPS